VTYVRVEMRLPLDCASLAQSLAQPMRAHWHVFLAQGVYQDLNDLADSSAAGWRLERADDMNSAGQIIGVGRDPLGELHAYMLTPNNGSGTLTSNVTEPAGVVLVGLGAVSMCCPSQSPGPTGSRANQLLLGEPRCGCRFGAAHP
jgi:hypothetical protein